MLLAFLFMATGFEYLLIDPVAERAGMGYGLCGDGYSINYNPAGIVLTENPCYSISYLNYMCGTHFGYLGYERKEFGLGIKYFYSGRIKKTDALGSELGYFSANFIDANIGKAFYFKDFFVGASLKLGYEKIDTLFAGGLGVDIGCLYFLSAENIQIGLGLKNIGMTIKPFIDEKERFPYEINLGIVKRFEAGWVGLDLVKSELFNFVWRLGGKYEINPIFALKASYNSLFSQMKIGTGIDFLTGIGIGFEITKAPLKINYFYTPFFTLGHGHRISIKLGG